MARSAFEAASSALLSAQSAHEFEIERLSAEVDRLIVSLVASQATDRQVLQQSLSAVHVEPSHVAFLSSPVIPVHVTAHDGQATWYIHQKILSKSAYFLSYLERWQQQDTLELLVPEDLKLQDAEAFMSYLYQPRRICSFAEAAAMFQLAKYMEVESHIDDVLAAIIHYARDSHGSQLRTLAARYGCKKIEGVAKQLGDYMASDEALHKAINLIGQYEDNRRGVDDPIYVQGQGLVRHIESILQKRASIGKRTTDVANCIRQIREAICSGRLFFRKQVETDQYGNHFLRINENGKLKEFWMLLKPYFTELEAFVEMTKLFEAVRDTKYLVPFGACIPCLCTRASLAECLGLGYAVLREMRSDMVVLGACLVDAGRLQAHVVLELIEQARPRSAYAFTLRNYVQKRHYNKDPIPMLDAALIACLRSGLRQQLVTKLVRDWGVVDLNEEVRLELRR